MSLLEINNVSFRFPDGFYAVKEVSLKIEKGECILLAGKNGSGKTVLMKLIKGLLTPREGSILLHGVPIEKIPHRMIQSVGLVFQNPDHQFVGATIEEDIAFGPENLGFPREKREELTKKYLHLMGLEEKAELNPHSLSGGEKRRLALAGVLAMDPELIILDEPFAGLDLPGVQTCLRELLDLREKGHTLMVISHDVEKCAAHSDRLIIMEGGRIMADGPTQSILGRVGEFGIHPPRGFNPEDPSSLSGITWL